MNKKYTADFFSFIGNLYLKSQSQKYTLSINPFFGPCFEYTKIPLNSRNKTNSFMSSSHKTNIKVWNAQQTDCNIHFVNRFLMDFRMNSNLNNININTMYNIYNIINVSYYAWKNGFCFLYK